MKALYILNEIKKGKLSVFDQLRIGKKKMECDNFIEAMKILNNYQLMFMYGAEIDRYAEDPYNRYAERELFIPCVYTRLENGNHQLIVDTSVKLDWNMDVTLEFNDGDSCVYPSDGYYGGDGVEIEDFHTQYDPIEPVFLDLNTDQLANRYIHCIIKYFFDVIEPNI